jgi:hypothetical protein
VLAGEGEIEREERRGKGEVVLAAGYLSIYYSSSSCCFLVVCL